METPLKVLRNKHLDNVQQISTPLKIPPSPLLKNLGYGTGVQVFCLERSPRFGKFRSPWAVKKIAKFNTTTSTQNITYQKRLKEEAEILRKLNHPNIIGFRGYNETKDGSDSLVLEYCHISLGQILEERYENENGPLEAEKILRMSIDILKALDYLHNEAKLLHGDLKSYNILVKGDFEICKLCDFGVSLPLDEDGFIADNKPYVGTELWSAPEVVDQSEKICYKADIFSFGLIIYETIALIPPHTWSTRENIDKDDGDDDNSKNFTDESLEKENDSDLLSSTCSTYDEESFDDIKFALGTRPPLPQALTLDDKYNKVIEVFYLCTNDCPENRPNAHDLHQALMENN